MSRHVFIVMGDTAYEGSEMLRAFDSQEAADTFLAKCRQHAEKEPRCPGLDDPDEDWTDYDLKRKRWERRSPRGYSNAHAYSVRKLSLGTMVGGRLRG